MYSIEFTVIINVKPKKTTSNLKQVRLGYIQEFGSTFFSLKCLMIFKKLPF